VTQVQALRHAHFRSSGAFIFGVDPAIAGFEIPHECRSKMKECPKEQLAVDDSIPLHR
jgi:hypothetical protein